MSSGPTPPFLPSPMASPPKPTQSAQPHLGAAQHPPPPLHAAARPGPQGSESRVAGGSPSALGPAIRLCWTHWPPRGPHVPGQVLQIPGLALEPCDLSQEKGLLSPEGKGSWKQSVCPPHPSPNIGGPVPRRASWGLGGGEGTGLTLGTSPAGAEGAATSGAGCAFPKFCRKLSREPETKPGDRLFFCCYL